MAFRLSKNGSSIIFENDGRKWIKDWSEYGFRNYSIGGNDYIITYLESQTPALKLFDGLYSDLLNADDSDNPFTETTLNSFLASFEAGGGGGSSDTTAANQVLQITEAGITNTKLDALQTELEKKADLTETQPVSVSSSILPTGASTEEKQDASNTTLTEIKGVLDGEIDVNVNENELGVDAWGRNKVIQDDSIRHSLFTYNVPKKIWKEEFNGTERTITNATSLNGKLNLVAGSSLDDVTYLRTYRNPRYQPNRGHLYSSSIILPNPNGAGARAWGSFTNESGAFFALISSVLFAVVRTTIDGVTSNDSYVIDTTGIDLSKGNIYDIQMQWRGVGNYKFFINLNEVKKIDYLGNRTELTMFNPANPLAFECVNLGDNVVIQCGCVDVSSEGGDNKGYEYDSFGISSEQGEVAYVNLNQPIIAVRSKLTVGGLINTRDTLALLSSFYSDEKSICRVWATRDFTAITEGNSSWVDIGDGHLEGIERTEIAGTLSFDTSKAKLIFTCRVAKEQTYSTSALFEGRTEIYQTPGDMFVFTMHRENAGATKGGVTYEYGEAI